MREADRLREWRQFPVRQQGIGLQPSTSNPVIGAQGASQSGVTSPDIAQAAAFAVLNQALPGVIPSGSANTAASANINNVSAATLDNVGDSTTFGRVHQIALTSNNVDPSKAGVISKGNTPFSITGSFTYTSTTTSITWTWTGLTVYRGDGTTTSITNGSQAITGLSSSTTYNFFPYFLDDGISTAVSWVAGGSGSPGFAFTNTPAAQIQSANLQNRIPLSSGSLVGVTPSSGSGGGSGGGGGGGGCFSGNCSVFTPTGYKPFSECPSTPFEITNETGVHKAEIIPHEHYSGEMIDMGGGEFVTTDHLMKKGSSWVPADLYFPFNRRVFFPEITVYDLHVLSEDPKNAHFVLNNGHIAHNKIIPD
jgi:hypothetical protein